MADALRPVVVLNDLTWSDLFREGYVSPGTISITGQVYAGEVSAAGVAAVCVRRRLLQPAGEFLIGPKRCGPLTSRRAERTSGPEKFRRSVKKDFFNKYLPKADVATFMCVVSTIKDSV